jgi:hypothetical protein
MNKNYVWYVAFGTNMLKERFMVYIKGGKFRGKGKGKDNKNYRGCRDTTPPLAEKPFIIPRELYFGKESSLWDNSGVAFLDADKPGITLGRAYLITEEQFTDIQTQEGPKWYERIIKFENDVNGIPHKTFTSTNRFKANDCKDNYIDVMFEGLCETYYPNLPYNRFHRLMREAIKHLGKPYASSINSNGNGPDAFDCVWFIGWIFRESGVDDILKRRTLSTLDKAFTTIGVNELKKEGDVLFFCKPPKNKITHVGMYIGHNLMIHATQPNGHEIGSVRLDDITEGNWLKRLVAIGRMSTIMEKSD